MTNWLTKKLSELLSSNDAGIWGSLIEKEEDGALILRSTNFNSNGTIDFKDVACRKIPKDKIKNSLLLNGDILLEKSGGGTEQPVGRVVYFYASSNKEYTFANFIQRLRADSKLINDRFLFYYLFNLYQKGFTQRLQSQTTGIHNLNLNLYLKINVPLPPLKIQQKIVSRLGAVKKAQELNDKQIILTDELFQSLLHRELDPKGKDWEGKKLGEITQKITDGTHKTPKYVLKGVPFITTVNLIPFGDNFNFSTYKKFISRKEHLELIKRAKPEKGDILISKCGTIGIAQVVRVNYEFSIFVGLMLVKPNKDKVYSEFLEYYLNQPLIKKKLELLSLSATRPTLPIRTLQKFPILLPPIETQKKIVQKLSAVQDFKNKFLEQKQKLKELFESVLHKSMR